jgi:hypothetical protein
MSGIEPVLSGNGSTLLSMSTYRGGEIVFINDDLMFSDKLLLSKDNAVLLNNIFKDYYHTHIAFDISAGSPGKTPGKVSGEFFLAKGNFPYIVLQACLLALAFFLANFKRFGNILDYGKYKKRSIANHLEAAGNFLSNSGNTAALSSIFDDYFIEKISRLYPGRSREELFGSLEKRYGDVFNGSSFGKDRGRDLARIEEKRRKVIKIIEKGE